MSWLSLLLAGFQVATYGRFWVATEVLLADLSITYTHSRPYTSNDNPFSESQFRTMKYRPEFPDRFGCIQDSSVRL